ncbi:MAG TPA: NUDIX hydrolase [Lachnospiraceae bacterium]|nr:NUDIX hydrolase [Lachnospiraceae bacterium]
MERAENRVKNVSKCGESVPELWDAYLADGTVTGRVLVRGEQIPEGLYHAGAEVFVLHDDGSVLLMQRDWSKPNYPGHWESGASGSVVKGESFLHGALRELWEETGIRAQELEPIYTVVRRNAIYKGYLCRTDVPKDAVTLQPGETIAYRWAEWQQFMEIYESADFVDTLRERLSEFVTGLSEGKESPFIGSGKDCF